MEVGTMPEEEKPASGALPPGLPPLIPATGLPPPSGSNLTLESRMGFLRRI
jgi:hypothetical protein